MGIESHKNHQFALTFEPGPTFPFRLLPAAKGSTRVYSQAKINRPVVIVDGYTAKEFPRSSSQRSPEGLYTLPCT